MSNSRNFNMFCQPVVIGLLLVALLGCLASGVQAKIILSHYGNADPDADEGWAAYITPNVTGSPVTGDMGYDAWVTDDQDAVTSGNRTFYQLAIAAEDATEAAANGWILRTRMRVEDPDLTIGGSAKIFFDFGPSSQQYQLDFTIDGLGNTIVGSYNFDVTPAPRYDGYVTIAGEGYHLYELKWDPVAQTADLFVDGVEELSNLVGRDRASSNRVIFGAANQADQAIGYWNLVEFEIVPEPSTLSLLGIALMTMVVSIRSRKRA